MRFSRKLIVSAFALASCDAGTEPVMISRIEFVEPVSRLDAGATDTLEIRAQDASGNAVSSPEVRWTSSDTLVATVTNGIVKGGTPGKAEIVASAGEVEAKTLLIVEPRLSKIRVLVPSPRLAVGAELSLFLMLFDEAGTGLPYLQDDGSLLLARSVQFTSSDSTILAVDSLGHVTARGVGTASITMNAGGASAQASFTVMPPYAFTVVRIAPGFIRPGLSGSGSAIWREGPTSYLYDGSSVTSLGEWQASDLNSTGTVVGCRNDEAVLWNAGTFVRLRPDSPRSSCATAINDHGDIGGFEVRSTQMYGQFSPFLLLQHGEVRIDETLSFKPIVINNAGSVLGHVNARHDYAYLWNGTQVRNVVPETVLGLPTDMNDAGDITLDRIGSGSPDGPYLVTNDGSRVRLTPPGFLYTWSFVTPVVGCNTSIFDVSANAVDAERQIVGGAYCRGWLWREGEFDPLDLIAPVPGWSIVEGLDINDKGQILARGNAPNGQQALLLLTPPAN